MKKVLITGGSGLVGTALTKLLLLEGFEVRHLGREVRPNASVPVFRWDVARGILDERALDGVDHIIHLSGANLAGKRWTAARRHELRASRVEAAELLRQSAERTNAWPSAFISASGVNYYGTATSDHVFTEDDPAATDFLGELCRDWESAADKWGTHCRVVKMRTAVALSKEGGALCKMAAPARWGLAAPLGSGSQWMPWVHIEDLARAYLHAIRDTGLHGAYNIAAREQVRNLEFMHEVAKALHRPFFLPPVPEVLLRILLDGPGNLIMNGSRVSNERLEASGFMFKHPRLAEALGNLLG